MIPLFVTLKSSGKCEQTSGESTEKTKLYIQGYDKALYLQGEREPPKGIPHHRARAER